MSRLYRALIMGAGKIGAFFDSPESKNVLSHAHALHKSPNFCITGFVDTNYDAAVRAASVWGGKPYKNIKDVIDGAIDVIIISTPDDCHYDNLKEVLNLNPNLIILEKPITKTMSEAEEIIELYKNKAILVNYSRRFLNEYENIKNDIVHGKYGNFLYGSTYYGKGIVHNGSHTINLVTYFLGKFSSYTINKKIFDFYSDDPSVGCTLRYANGADMHIVPIDCNIVAIFELDMMFEKKRVTLVNLGYDIVIYDNSPSQVYKGYSNYIYKETLNIDFSQSLINLYKEAHKYLECGELRGCSLAEAYETMKICSELRNANE